MNGINDEELFLKYFVLSSAVYPSLSFRLINKFDNNYGGCGFAQATKYVGKWRLVDSEFGFLLLFY